MSQTRRKSMQFLEQFIGFRCFFLQLYLNRLYENPIFQCYLSFAKGFCFVRLKSEIVFTPFVSEIRYQCIQSFLFAILFLLHFIAYSFLLLLLWLFVVFHFSMLYILFSFFCITSKEEGNFMWKSKSWVFSCFTTIHNIHTSYHTTHPHLYLICICSINFYLSVFIFRFILIYR